MSGCLIAENSHSQIRAQKREQADAENSHIEAVAQRSGDGLFDAAAVVLSLGLCHSGKQDYGQGIGDGGGKENKGQGHAGQNSVQAQGVRMAQSESNQPVRHEDGFQTLQAV